MTVNENREDLLKLKLFFPRLVRWKALALRKMVGKENIKIRITIISKKLIIDKAVFKHKNSRDSPKMAV